MNLDRLLKLLKLANHNPNDSEANSAARAASRMLGEENYKWLEDAKKNGGHPPRASKGEPTIKEFTDPRTGEITIKISQLDAHDNPRVYQLLKQLQAELRRPRTWSDVNRSKEPYWRSTYKGGERGGKGDWDKDESWGESTGFDWEKEFWKRYQKETEERAKRERHEQNYNYDPFKDFKKGFYGGVDWDKPPKTPPKREPVNWSWTQHEEGGNVRYRKVYEQHVRNCSKCGYTQLTSDDTTPFVCYNCKKKEQK